MTQQLDLLPRRNQTKVKPADILAMKAVLNGMGWVKRRRLELMLDWPERKFRAVCKASRGEILGSCKGYAITSQAPVEDAHHAARRLRAMAKEIHLSAINIERHIHRPNGVTQ